jgi:hypothetical protein
MEASSNFPPLLEIRTARGKKFIHTSEITHIKSANKHCLVHFINSDTPIEAHCLLKWFTENLPEPQYCRCPDSYIVNFGFYDCISGNNIVLRNNVFIPISAKRKNSCIQMLKGYLIDIKRICA